MGEERAGAEDVGDLARAVGERVAQVFRRIVLVRLDLLAALLIAFRIAFLDRLVAGHLLDDP